MYKVQINRKYFIQNSNPLPFDCNEVYILQKPKDKTCNFAKRQKLRSFGRAQLKLVSSGVREALAGADMTP